MGIKKDVFENGVLVESVDTRTPEEVVRDAQYPVIVKIEELEAAITPRRTREAILGIDNGWLANQEALIAAERAKL